MTKLAIIMLGVAAACSSDPSTPPPSCQESLDNYYGAGCTYIDTSTGMATPEISAIGVCENIAVAVPPECEGAFDAWLDCNAKIVGPIRTTSDCDCSAQYMTLITCK